MTETLAAFLVAWSLESLSSPRRHKDWTSGILIGLATLCRPSLLIGSGLAVAARGFYAAGPWPLRAWAALRIVLAIMMVLCPWALRNALLFGEPVWTTTHGGYTLALANNPVYYRDVVNGPPDRVWEGQEQWLWWDSINKATSGMTEPQADRFLRMSAVRLMASQPNTFIKATWQRVTRFWSIAPSSAVYSPRIRLICAIWTIPLWTALIFGLKTSRSWTYPLVYACLTVFGLTLVHTLYWTDMRMRAPIVPAIALIAAVPFTRSPVNPPSGDERENCPLPEGV